MDIEIIRLKLKLERYQNMVNIKTYTTLLEHDNTVEATSKLSAADAEKYKFDISRVILALDRMSINKANDLIVQYHKKIFGFKVNHLLYGFVRKYLRNIFVDYKLHDIPHTMNLIVERCIKDRTNMITIHMSNSEEAFKQLEKYTSHIKLLGVTALTSMSEEECQQTYNKSIEEMYDRSISLMNQYNFWGAICAPHDLKYFEKHKASQLKKICPGIQIQPMDNDQVRTATPQEAIDAGADYLVMGRSFFEEYHEDFHTKH
jgi:orotidine-5'-phosphate decarboxylase